MGVVATLMPLFPISSKTLSMLIASIGATLGALLSLDNYSKVREMQTNLLHVVRLIMVRH